MEVETGTVVFLCVAEAMPKIALSKRHAAAHPQGPDVDVVSDAAIFAANAYLRPAAKAHGYSTCCTGGPSLLERHGRKADCGRIVVREIVIAVQAYYDLGIYFHSLCSNRFVERTFRMLGQSE